MEKTEEVNDARVNDEVSLAKKKFTTGKILMYSQKLRIAGKTKSLRFG